MPSPWGAALESLGSGLMKFGMMKMDQEQDLEKEARADARLLASEERAYKRALELDAAKEAAKAAREAAVQKLHGERIAAAQTKGGGLLTSRIQEGLGMPELQRLQGVAAEAWKADAPTAPTVRDKTLATEADAFRDMPQAQRDIYAANLREQMGYVKSLKPSQEAVDRAAWQELMAANPDTAKQFGDYLKMKYDLDKPYPDPDRNKVHVSMTADGRILSWDDTGRYTLEGKPKATGGAKELTQAQLSNNAEIETARKQVRLWQEKGDTAEALSVDPAKAKTLAKALQRKVGTDPDYDLYHAHLGQNMTQQELAARRQPAPTTATASKKLTLDQLNAARDDKQKEWAGKLAAKKITQAQYDDYMAKLKTGYDAEVAKLK